MKIYVGKERKVWTLPEELLCDKVEFFRASFKSGFKEGITKELSLEEESPEVFAKFVDWIMAQACRGLSFNFQCNECGLMAKAEAEKQKVEPTRQEKHRDNSIVWLMLHRLAQFFLLPKLAEEAEIRYVKCITNLQYIPTVSQIIYVYENTDHISSLRISVVDLVAGYYYSKNSGGCSWAETFSCNPIFCEDLIQTMRNHDDILPSHSFSCRWSSQCKTHGSWSRWEGPDTPSGWWRFMGERRISVKGTMQVRSLAIFGTSN